MKRSRQAPRSKGWDLKGPVRKKKPLGPDPVCGAGELREANGSLQPETLPGAVHSGDSYEHQLRQRAPFPLAVWTWEIPLTFPFPLYLQVEITKPHEVVARTGEGATGNGWQGRHGGRGRGLGNATYSDCD